MVQVRISSIPMAIGVQTRRFADPRIALKLKLALRLLATQKAVQEWLLEFGLLHFPRISERGCYPDGWSLVILVSCIPLPHIPHKCHDNLLHQMASLDLRNFWRWLGADEASVPCQIATLKLLRINWLTLVLKTNGT